MTTLRERIRTAELERARRYFSPGAKVLEIGGGPGYQAAILSSWGMDVTSLDVVAATAAHHPVQIFDGRTIPFPGESLDAVFSSNVLEHVEDVEALLGEAARVLKADGVMVHVLPSATWRWWTSVAHYAWVVLSVILRRPNPEAPDAAPRRPRSPLNLLRFAWLIAFPHAHGVYSSAAAEQYCYSRFRWKRLFESCGLEVLDVRPAGVFYTAFKIFASMDVPRRTRLARLLGSSCLIYVLRRAPAR